MDTDYQNKHYNINQKDEGTQDDRRRDRGTNFTLRIKEQETRLTLQEHDDDDDDDDEHVARGAALFPVDTSHCRVLSEFVSQMSPP